MSNYPPDLYGGVPSYGESGGGGGSEYSPPSWPDIEADEEFRAKLETADANAFQDVSGKGNHGLISGQRPAFSAFLGKAAIATTGGSCRVFGFPSIRRNREWTVDAVIQKPTNATGTQVIFHLSNISSGNLKGGLQTSSSQWQIWTPTGWVNIGILPIFYSQGIQNTERIAITMQWDSSDILHLWANDWKAYTSTAPLTPPAVVGDEGIYIPNGPSIEFFRYRAASPTNPNNWQSKALYGG